MSSVVHPSIVKFSEILIKLEVGQFVSIENFTISNIFARAHSLYNNHIDLDLDSQNFFLFLSRNRLKHLINAELSANFFIVDVSTLADNQIQDLAYGDIEYKDRDLRKYISSNAIDIEETEFAPLTKPLSYIYRTGEMIPSFLIYKENTKQCRSQISFDEINFAEKNQENYFKFITSTKLNLDKINHEVEFRIYKNYYNGRQHYAIIIGDPYQVINPPLIRMHSSCYTGDLLNSLACDCNSQLMSALEKMDLYAEDMKSYGVLLYLNQEGRGIGLASKSMTYNQQSKGLDTVEANEFLGYLDDERNFDCAKFILQDLQIDACSLLTNNPKKTKFLARNGIRVDEIYSHYVSIHDHNVAYLETKIQKMNHKRWDEP